MEELKSQLETFHSSFQAEETVKRLKESRRQELINKILSESNDDLTQLEKERNLNFLSFLFFVKNDNEKAYELNSQVLKLNPKNMIAIVNKTWFQLKDLKGLSELDDKLREIKDLQHNKLISIVAKAEVAYTFSRLGVTKQYRRAYELYRQIFEECFPVIQSGLRYEPDIHIPKEYLYIWTFGYCLIQRRCLHIGNMPIGDEIEPSFAQYRRLLETLFQITSMERAPIHSIHMARLYAELGMTVFHIDKNKKEFPYGLQSILSGSELGAKFQSAEWYFNQARLAKPSDYFILDRCGKYFRYVKEIEQAIKCLDASVRMKHTSSGFHHLGLAYKTKLELKLSKEKNVIWELGADGLEEPWTLKKAKKTTPVPTQKALRENDENDSTTERLIKSPLTLRAIKMNENSKAVKTILECFDKALKISENMHALYDKGLLLRQTRQFDEALKVFERMIKNEDRSSLINIANAYEQSALCVAGLKHTGNVEDEDSLTKNIKIYLKSAIEISCKLSSRIPRLNNCWNAAQILKEIVKKQEDTKDKFEDLLYVYNQGDNYEDKLKVLDELLECGPAVSDKAKLVQDKVRCLMNLNKLDDSVVLLEVFKKDYGSEHIQEHLYKSLNVVAGIHAFSAEENCKAELRLRNAFDFGQPVKKTGYEADDSEKYDILILSNLSNDENGNQLMRLLKARGLKVKSNADILPGQDILQTLKKSIPKSNYFVIISDMDDDESTREEHLINCIQSTIQAAQSNITVVNNINHPLPEFLRGYESIEMDFCRLRSEHIELLADQNTCNILTSLIRKVLRC